MDRQQPQYRNTTSRDEGHAFYIRVPTADDPAYGPYGIHYPQGQIPTNPGFTPLPYLDERHCPNPAMLMPPSPYDRGLPPAQSTVGYPYGSYPTPCPSTTRLVQSAYDDSAISSARTSVMSVEDRFQDTSSAQPLIDRSDPEASPGRIISFASQTSMAAQDTGPYYPLEVEEEEHHGWYEPPFLFKETRADIKPVVALLSGACGANGKQLVTSPRANPIIPHPAFYDLDLPRLNLHLDLQLDLRLNLRLNLQLNL
jgi:hypothetical protein